MASDDQDLQSILDEIKEDLDSDFNEILNEIKLDLDSDFEKTLSEIKADIDESFNKKIEETKESINDTDIDYTFLEEKVKEFVEKQKEELDRFKEELKEKQDLQIQSIKEEKLENSIPTFSKYDSHFNKLIERWDKRLNTLASNISMKAASGSSGGSTQILDNDDVVFKQVDTVANNQILSFDADQSKFAVSNTLNELQRDVRLESMTGLISGGSISISNFSNTKFDIAAGRAEFVDTTDLDNPKEYYVTWDRFANLDPTFLSNSTITFISIDQEKNIIQRTRDLTPVERRREVFLGHVDHPDNTTISDALNSPTVSLEVGSQLYDHMYGIGRFVISGLKVSSFNGDLQINVANGQIFSVGSNFRTDEDNPHYIQIGLESPTPFRYRTQSGVEGANTTFIEPGFYDLNGTRTAIPGAGNRASIQRVYVFPNDRIRIQYGQDYYDNITQALENIQTESFIEEDDVSENGILLGLIVARKGATDLSLNTDARFVTVGRFGDIRSVSTEVVGTLQQIYNNSVIHPEITLNATNRGIDIHDSQTPLNENLFSISNFADTVDYFAVNSTATLITGDLNVTGTATSFTRVAVTSNTATISNTTFDTTEGFIGVNNTSNTTVNVQSGFEVGRRLIIKDESGNAASNKIVINTVDNVDGANTFTIQINRGSITMVYTGFEWSII